MAMLDRSSLKHFKPLFLTPCYAAQVCTNYFNSMLALTNAVWPTGMQAVIRLRAGESLITRARNELVAEFLADASYTHLFWVDADIGFNPEDVFRLLLADRDVVAGVYPLKTINWPQLPDGTPAPLAEGLTRESFFAHYLRYPVNAHDAVDMDIDADGFLEVSEAPTGFMCIKRSVFLTMFGRLPDLKYTPDGPRSMPHRDHCYRFFDVMVEPGSSRYLSEDYAFCRRWRDLGGKVYIDTRSKLSHQGIYTFNGDFGASMQTSPLTAIGGEVFGEQ